MRTVTIVCDLSTNGLVYVFTGRFGWTVDAGEDWSVVPDWDRVSRLLVRSARTARHLSQGGVDG